MRIVIVAWALTVVTLIAIVFAVALWDECGSEGTVIARYGGEGRQVLDHGGRFVAWPTGGGYWCRPRIVGLFYR